MGTDVLSPSVASPARYFGLMPEAVTLRTVLAKAITARARHAIPRWDQLPSFTRGVVVVDLSKERLLHLIDRIERGHSQLGFPADSSPSARAIGMFARSVHGGVQTLCAPRKRVKRPVRRFVKRWSYPMVGNHH